MKQTPQTAEAVWLSLFGESTRLVIIRALATGDKNVTALAKGCGTEVVNVSHHLRLMAKAGLLTSVRDGRNVVYSLVGARAAGGQLEFAHESGTRLFVSLH